MSATSSDDNVGEIMTGPLRAALLGLFFACLLGASPTPSQAGSYPDHPVRFINGFSPGGPVDTIARIMAQALSDRLGQQFVVENRAGSGGNLATAAAISSPPDGYTVVFSGSNNAISASLYKHLPFNFMQRHDAHRHVHGSAQPDGGVEYDAGENHPGVHRLLQGQSGQDLLCLVRQRHHRAYVRRILQGDDQVRHAARPLSRLGAGDAGRDLEQGAADLRQPADSAGTGAWRQRPRARSDICKALAELPDIPAIAETVPGFEATVFYGMSAPKGTPPEIIATLNKAINEC